jgi:hypothetical protein
VALALCGAGAASSCTERLGGHVREAPLTGNVFAHLCSKPSLSNSKCQPAPASMTAKPSLPSRQQASRQKASQQAHHPCRQASLPAFQSASQQASQPCLQTASRPASQPAQPDSQLVSQPASQPAIQGKLEAERLQKVFRGCLLKRNFGRTGKTQFSKVIKFKVRISHFPPKCYS